jgi:peptidoglycan hydrolase-like protein with peptidoglycan-binding domain
MRTLALLLASTSILVAGCAGDRGTGTTQRTTGQTTATAADPTTGSTRMPSGRSTGNVSDSGTVAHIGTPGTSGGAVPPGGFVSAAVLSSPEDVRTVQNRLRQLNYYGGEMNGLWNADTDLGLRNFQRANGLPVGPLDQRALTAMGLSGSVSGGRISDVTSMREPRMAAQPGTATEAGRMAHMQQMSESDRMAQMRQMHAQLHREMDQRQGMSNIAPSAGPGAAAGMTGRNLDQQSVRQVQQKLAAEGYYKIPVDGIWGSKSQDALVQFQQNRNLPATGRLTPETVSAMGLDSSTLRQRSGRSL